MTQDYYEVLGAARDASDEELRQAYRRAASKHHPDRGGNAEEFKKAGRAYEVLSNPQRRAAYDEHGHDGTESSTDPRAMAEAALAAIFDEMLGQGGNLVVAVRKKVTDTSEALIARRAAALEKRGKLVLRKPKVTTKNGAVNLFAQVVDKRIAALDAEIAKIDTAAVVADVMLKMLDDYGDSEPAVQTWATSDMESAIKAALGSRRFGRTGGF